MDYSGRTLYTLSDKPAVLLAVEERNPDGAEFDKAWTVADHVIQHVWLSEMWKRLTLPVRMRSSLVNSEADFSIGCDPEDIAARVVDGAVELQLLHRKIVVLLNVAPEALHYEMDMLL